MSPGYPGPGLEASAAPPERRAIAGLCGDAASRVLGHALRRQALGHWLHEQVDVPSLSGLADLAPALFEPTRAPK